MATIKAVAPAKVNLTLHVTGQRADGYHLLDSLVVFTDTGDLITAAPSDQLTLTVTGPFAAGVPTDASNLILRAAETLRRVRGVIAGAAITVEKHLPNEAGLGGGSSDAATTLKLLAQMWDVAPLPANSAEVVMLGADVPVCLSAPRPVRFQGIGDELTPVPALPPFAMVLVNPKVAVPTSLAFNGLASKQNPAMTDMPADMALADFADWLTLQRNDLQPPAIAAAPVIQSVLDKMQKLPTIAYAGMSGSGATCFGITKTMADARHAARVIQVAEMGWWVTPAQIQNR